MPAAVTWAYCPAVQRRSTQDLTGFKVCWEALRTSTYVDDADVAATRRTAMAMLYLSTRRRGLGDNVERVRSFLMGTLRFEALACDTDVERVRAWATSNVAGMWGLYAMGALPTDEERPETIFAALPPRQVSAAAPFDKSRDYWLLAQDGPLLQSPTFPTPKERLSDPRFVAHQKRRNKVSGFLQFARPVSGSLLEHRGYAAFEGAGCATDDDLPTRGSLSVLKVGADGAVVLGTEREAVEHRRLEENTPGPASGVRLPRDYSEATELERELHCWRIAEPTEFVCAETLRTIRIRADDLLVRHVVREHVEAESIDSNRAFAFAETARVARPPIVAHFLLRKVDERVMRSHLERTVDHLEAHAVDQFAQLLFQADAELLTTIVDHRRAAIRALTSVEVIDVENGTTVQQARPAGQVVAAQRTVKKRRRTVLASMAEQVGSLKRVKKEKAAVAKDLTKARQEQEEAQDRLVCLICFEEPRSRLLLPCSHFGFCDACAQAAVANGQCPSCRQEITSVQNVLMP